MLTAFGVESQNQLLRLALTLDGSSLALHYHDLRVPRASASEGSPVTRPAFLTRRRLAVPSGGPLAESGGLGPWRLSIHHQRDPSRPWLVLGSGERRPMAASAMRAGGGVRVLDAVDDLIHEFDGTDRHVASRDPRTDTPRWILSYDEAGRLSSAVDDHGTGISFESPDEATIFVVASPDVRSTLHLDTDGRLIGATGWEGGQVAFAYDSNGLLSAWRDAGGRDVRVARDDAGRVTTMDDPQGRSTWTRVPVDHGYAVSVMSPTGSERRFEVTTPEAGVDRRTQTCCEGLSSVRERTDDHSTTRYSDGTVVTLEERHDHEGAIRLERAVHTPAGATAGLVVSSAVPVATAPPAPHTTTFELAGGRWTSAYDPASRSVTDLAPSGRWWVTTLDERGRVVRSHQCGIDPVDFSYRDDGTERLVSWTQGDDGGSWRFDGWGRLLGWDLPGGPSLLERDRSGSVVSARSASGATVQAEPDANGRPVTMTQPSGGRHVIERDGAGRWLGFTDPLGNRLQVARDAEGRVVELDRPGGGNSRATYDAVGRLVRIEGGTGRLEVTRDPASGEVSRVTRSTGDAEVVLQYQRDGPLVVGVECDVDGATSSVAYRYDEHLRVIGVSVDGDEDPRTHDIDGLEASIGSFAIERDPSTGLPTRLTDGNASTTVSYDSRGRVTGRQLTIEGREVHRLALTWGPHSRVRTRTETIGADEESLHYTYDADGQLVEVRVDDEVVESYAYDDNGNPTTLRHRGADGVEATYLADDRPAQCNGLPAEVDASGQLRAAGGMKVEWDDLDQPARFVTDDGVAEFRYDAMGRRVASLSEGRVVRYVYANLLRPLQVSSLITGDGQVSHLRYAPSGELMAFDVGSDRFYVACDQVGTPRLVVDARGITVRRVTHDSFGRVVSDTAGDAGPALGFAGGLVDGLTGLVRFGMRDYDPRSARWISKDPLGLEASDLNPYRYAWNDPVNRTDLTGTNSGAAGTNVDFSRYTGLGRGLEGESWYTPPPAGPPATYPVTQYPKPWVTNLAGDPNPTPGLPIWKSGFTGGYTSYTILDRFASCRVSAGSGNALPDTPASDIVGADRQLHPWIENRMVEPAPESGVPQVGITFTIHF